MKPEEILKDKGITRTTKHHNYEYLYNSTVEAMKTFGKLTFEAGRRYHRTFYQDGYDQYKYEVFEDYLKELYNEK